MTVKNKIRELQKAVETTEMSPLEEQRLARDLARVCQRIVQREYAETDFTGNTFNVPDRTREFFDNFKAYNHQAETWARILARLDLNPGDDIIDLCPGWSPKIALGLWRVGYKGRLILADKSRVSLEGVVGFMRLFRPLYKMETAVMDVFEPISLRAKTVLANHIVDDLVLSLTSRRLGLDPETAYMEESALRGIWEAVLNDKDRVFEEAVTLLSRVIGQMTLPNGLVVLTQYQSYMERLLGLSKGVNLCRGILSEVSRQLCQGGFASDPKVLSAAFDGFNGYFQAGDCVLLTRP